MRFIFNAYSHKPKNTSYVKVTATYEELKVKHYNPYHF